MSGFSDDGQWWWDGQAWVATSQVLIPDLPPTDHQKELDRLGLGRVWGRNRALLEQYPR